MSRSKKPPDGHKPAPQKDAKMTGDDAVLWQHVKDSVKPLRRTRGKSVAPKSVTTGKKAASAPPPQKASAPTPRSTPRPAPPAPAAPAKGFDRATETRFRRGELEIEARLDLHGMTQDAAYRALMRFLDRAQNQHLRTVLVITGKGRLSEGGGVLRRLLPQWLEAGPYASRILACTSAHAKDGGTGAYYIRLRKPRG